MRLGNRPRKGGRLKGWSGLLAHAAVASPELRLKTIFDGVQEL
jgi:hypothetical protein